MTLYKLILIIKKDLDGHISSVFLIQMSICWVILKKCELVSFYNVVDQRERERLSLVVGERTPAFPPSIKAVVKSEDQCWLLKEPQPVVQSIRQLSDWMTLMQPAQMVQWKAGSWFKIKQILCTHTPNTHPFTMVKYLTSKKA